MTKRDEAVFARAFEAMEADGSLEKLRAKVRVKIRPNAKPVSNVGKKSRQKPVASVSGQNSVKSLPLAASKK
jgi:hypothetical protein